MKITTKRLTLWAVTAALYTAVTLVTASFAYGPVQFRVAEVLSVLCCFAPHMTVGVTLGCFLANLFSTVSALDVVIGTAASLLACLCMTRCRRPMTMILPNILFNAVFVGAMLGWVLTPDAFWAGFAVNALQVAAGEAAVMIVLGVPLYLFIQRSQRVRKLFQ